MDGEKGKPFLFGENAVPPPWFSMKIGAVYVLSARLSLYYDL